MLSDPKCPGCTALSWESLGQRVYNKAGISRLKGWDKKALQILFEVWAPEQESFHANFLGCKVCGLLIYTPRPTAEEVNAKYLYSAQIGDNNPSKHESAERAQIRQKRLLDIVKPVLSRPLLGANVLDFGGGDGRLLKHFVEEGASCDVIDYCLTPIDGVRHVGRTEEDLSESGKYDLIVCSHVVEHLPDPISTLRALVRSLSSQGLLYVEVPVEMVGRLPAAKEPVTHLNYFTAESLASLLRNSGVGVISSELRDYPHPNGGWKLCAIGLASPSADSKVVDQGLAGLNRYRSPSLSFRVKLLRMLWRDYFVKVRRKIAEL